MDVAIYFKERGKDSLIIRNVVSILGRNINPNENLRSYLGEKILTFAPVDEESYAFRTDAGSVNVNGREILYTIISEKNIVSNDKENTDLKEVSNTFIRGGKNESKNNDSSDNSNVGDDGE